MKNSDSVDGSLLFSCYFKPDFICDLVPKDPAIIPLDLDLELLGIAGFIGYWDNYREVINETVNIEEVFKIDSKPNYSVASHFSSKIIIAPDVDGTPILQLFTSPPLPKLLSEMVRQELGKMGVKTEIGGDDETSAQLTLREYPLPLNLIIDRETWQTRSDTLNV